MCHRSCRVPFNRTEQVGGRTADGRAKRGKRDEKNAVKQPLGAIGSMRLDLPRPRPTSHPTPSSHPHRPCPSKKTKGDRYLAITRSELKS